MTEAQGTEIINLLNYLVILNIFVFLISLVDFARRLFGLNKQN